MHRIHREAPINHANHSRRPPPPAALATVATGYANILLTVGCIAVP